MKYDLIRLTDVRILPLAGNISVPAERCWFVLILKGRADVLLNSEIVSYQSEDIFIAQSGINLDIQGKDSNLALVIEIVEPLLFEIIPNFEHIRLNSILYPQNYDVLIKAVAGIAKSNTDDGKQADFQKSAALYHFINLLFDYIPTEIDFNPKLNKVDSSLQQRIDAIYRYIHIHAAGQLSMKEVADHFHLTPQYFSKFFKSNFKINFINYIKNVRLNLAVADVLETRLTMTQIAFNSGFPNLSSFIKAFVEKFQMTPLKYRKMYADQQLVQAKSVPKTVEPVKCQIMAKTARELDDIIGHASEQSPDTIKTKRFQYSIDTTKSEPFENSFFDIINIGFASVLLSSSIQNHIKALQEDLNFKYARVQSILSQDIVDRIEQSDSFNFSKVYRIIDFIYSINMLPFFELLKTKQLFSANDQFLYYKEDSDIYDNIDDWEDCLQQFISGCTNRYGQSEVNKWKFELWLPHGPRLEYSENRIRSFIMHYKILSRVFKSTLPDCQIGGLGFNLTAQLSVLEKVLSQFSQQGLSIDFLSLISYHISNQDSTLKHKPQYTLDADFMKTKAVKAADYFKTLGIPTYLCEWNFDYSSRNYINDSIFKALFITKNLLENSFLYDSVAYWLLSDLTTEYKDTSQLLFGGNGLLTVSGIKKPAYYAYEFLSKLGRYQIFKTPGCLVTRNDQNTYQILLYNYNHPSASCCLERNASIEVTRVNGIFDAVPVKCFELTLDQIRSGEYRITTHLLSSTHGSILDEWLNMGLINNVKPEEINYLKNVAIPNQKVYFKHADHSLMIKDTVPANEIHLIHICLEI